ncbi:MAG: beta-N-acetylhexosaminidase [Kofleriaceae bacterium]
MRQDIGQLLWFGFAGPTVTPALRAKLDAGEIGATILFKRNLVVEAVTANGVTQEVTDVDALVALNAELHRSAPDGTPALVAVDHEGGVVQRVRAPATHWPPMLSHDQLEDAAAEILSEQVGRMLGHELRAMGFDVDFAPVLDIHTNPANPIIGNRAFGTTPDAVAKRALAFAQGLHEAGVLACGKHFPGHGDTTTDSHLELPRVDHSWERLAAVELEPFARAAKAKLPMIMTAHVVFAALDALRPATMSPKVVTGVLRDRLGYEGVIVSDDLDMSAIAEHMEVGFAAVSAVRAGCDVLLLCRREDHQAVAEEALIKEAEKDSAFRAIAGASAQRVRAMKKAHAQNQAARPAPGRDVIGSFEHRRLADRLAGR